jgi:hypothetical protein
VFERDPAGGSDRRFRIRFASRLVREDPARSRKSGVYLSWARPTRQRAGDAGGRPTARRALVSCGVFDVCALQDPADEPG